MTIKQIISHLRQNPKDFFYYFQGTIRYRIYLQFEHLIEQYLWRKKQAQACTDAKACLCCSCDTPSLYFSSKACSISKYPICKRIVNKEQECYPQMMNAKDWKNYKTKHNIKL